MPTHNRHDRILEVLTRRGSAGADELAEQLHVSRSTIERDLDTLAERGLVDRVPGGAAMNNTDKVPAPTGEPGGEPACSAHLDGVNERGY